MDKTVERLTLVVSEQGFAFARVRPRAHAEPGTRAINVTYVIDQGPRIYIERINIIGNLRTHDHVVRREFRLAEGDAYNPLMVDKAKKRLQGLGFFKTVEIKRRPGSAPDRVVLDVELVEQSTGELSFGAGYSTSEGVIGDVSITERNLLGRGQFLRLRLAGSAERLQVDLSFTEPRFLDRNLAAGFDLFHKDVNLSQLSAFRSQTTGGSLRLGFPLAENLWLTNSYTLSRGEIYDVNTLCRFAQRSRRPQGEAWTSVVSAPAIAYDTRNHPKTPTQRLLPSRSAPTSPGSAATCSTCAYRARPLLLPDHREDHLRRPRDRRPHHGLGRRRRAPDRPVLQGRRDGSRLQPRRLRPARPEHHDALGGNTFWATTAEVRFPLPFIPDDLGMSGAVFADAGSLFGAGAFAKGLRPGLQPRKHHRRLPRRRLSVRASAGASILWNSPLGPLRLDVAKAFMKKDYDVSS